MRKLLLHCCTCLLAVACSDKVNDKILVPHGKPTFWSCYAIETDSIPCLVYYVDATGKFLTFRCPPYGRFVYSKPKADWEESWDTLDDTLYILGGVPYALCKANDSTLCLVNPQDSLTLRKTRPESKLYRELLHLKETAK